MNIAIIGAGYMAGLFAERAKELGYKTHCFAWNKGATAKDLVDFYYPISITETEKILDVCKEQKIDGIVATTELTVSVANNIAIQMGLPSNPKDVTDNITNKYWQREKCKKAKLIHQPQFKKVSNINELKREIEMNFPVILKPVAEGGKRGVEVAYDAEQLKEKARLSFEADKRNKGIIIEEYLNDGNEYSVEGLSFCGKHQIIQITEKISSGPPHCVELGHSQPASVSNEMKKRIISAVKEVLDSVGFINGTTHIEIKTINDDIYLIEINARPGGDHIAHPLTLLSTGYDYLGEALKVCVGIEPKKANEGNSINYAGVRFITTQTSYLKPIFENCDSAEWLYKKHVESLDLQELNHNDCSHTNYIIYCSKEVPIELKEEHL